MSLKVFQFILVLNGMKKKTVSICSFYFPVKPKVLAFHQFCKKSPEPEMLNDDRPFRDIQLRETGLLMVPNVAVNVI